MQFFLKKYQLFLAVLLCTKRLPIPFFFDRYRQFFSGFTVLVKLFN